MLVRPFAAVRPNEQAASHVAALPYDVYDRAEARRAVEGRPLSFLNIDRPETQFAPDDDMYAPAVYAKARELFDARLADGTFVQDDAPCFYLYELEMEGRVQTGIVACCSIDEYLDGTIKKHENTLEAKERDRINHIDALDAQTGPIFLAYRDDAQVAALVDAARREAPMYDFTAEDGVAHRAWRIAGPDAIAGLSQAFSQVPCAYVADGHHRAASAVKVGLARRAAHPEYDGTEEFNYFLSVLFPSSQLSILPYNRVVRDLNGLTVEEFLAKLRETFEILHTQEQPLEPVDKGAVAMYLKGTWYGLGVLPQFESDDPVAGLDVAVLQERVLGPVLGIDDPRTDARIEFVGGIHGTGALAHRVMLAEEASREGGTLEERGPAVAFAMYPTSIDELMEVADAGLLMPPKSTWFEPKLRSGLFIHRI